MILRNREFFDLFTSFLEYLYTDSISRSLREAVGTAL